MNQILVTIFMPVYRHFDNIYAAIDSILNQDYKNVEFIVSDDGSKGFPYESIVAYIEVHNIKKYKYKVLANETNVGTVKHINNILKEASGDIYIPLAGDDILFDNTVVTQIVNRFKETPFNILATSSVCVDYNDNFLRLYPHSMTGDYMKQNLQDAVEQYNALAAWHFHDIASGSTMVHNAVFFKSIGGYDEDYVLWEDGPYLLKVTKLGYKIDMDYDIISIKYRSGGVSSTGNPILARDVEKCLSRLINESELDNSVKRHLRFIRSFSSATNIFKKAFFALLYFDVYIAEKIYNKEETKRGYKDMEKYLAQHKKL